MALLPFTRLVGRNLQPSCQTGNDICCPQHRRLLLLADSPTWHQEYCSSRALGERLLPTAPLASSTQPTLTMFVCCSTPYTASSMLHECCASDLPRSSGTSASQPQHPIPRPRCIPAPLRRRYHHHYLLDGPPLAHLLTPNFGTWQGKQPMELADAEAKEMKQRKIEWCGIAANGADVVLIDGSCRVWV